MKLVAMSVNVEYLLSSDENTCTGYFLSYAKCSMPRFNGRECCFVLL